MPTFERVQGWLPWCVALGVGLLFTPFIWPIVPLFFAVLSLTAVAMFGLARAIYLHHKPDKELDLRALTEFDEREELRRIREEIAPAEEDQVLCMSCGEVYEARLGVCPRCGRP